MKNSKYNSHDVKVTCENKLNIEFRSTKEFTGWYIFNSNKVARITIPKGKKFLPPKTYKSLAIQLKLSVSEFDDFLDCPLDKENYDIILKERL